MKKINNNVKILVIYVGVAGVRSEDIENYVNNVAKRITPTTFDSEIIIIPVQSTETRVECINPKYITDESLIIENERLMKELHNEINKQINILKENKNE